MTVIVFGIMFLGIVGAAVHLAMNGHPWLAMLALFVAGSMSYKPSEEAVLNSDGDGTEEGTE